jgi:deoxyribodipyrimidine photo-lyase
VSERSRPGGGALVLFTRDLRVNDNRALASAVREHDRVVTAFVLDREILAGCRAAPNRLAFLLECLEDLDASLRDRGSRLTIRHGDVVEEAMRLVHDSGLSAIHMSQDVTPYARLRRGRLEHACREARVELRGHPGVTLVAPGDVTPAGGDHYRVFTPYWRIWSGLDAGPPLRAPTRIAAPPRVPHGRVPKLASLSSGAPSTRLQRGGETAARAQLERWLRRGLEEYEGRRDELACEGTSRLSAYLHFGCLSPRTVLGRSRGRDAEESFARQLCWRDFHHQVLAARPDLPKSDYRPRGDRWRRDARSASAWREGLTGYPIVDAGMRQLAEEGFMHNRARLIVASFLTKTLYLDWRLGAAHFARLLLDADVASNVGNWQWVAGTGNDTRPNRVLNPLRQARRFDPRGDYVRRYVPELAGVQGGAVHEPWRLGRVGKALDYPPPLVDHEAGAAEFRARRLSVVLRGR